MPTTDLRLGFAQDKYGIVRVYNDDLTVARAYRITATEMSQWRQGIRTGITDAEWQAQIVQVFERGGRLNRAYRVQPQDLIDHATSRSRPYAAVRGTLTYGPPGVTEQEIADGRWRMFAAARMTGMGLDVGDMETLADGVRMCVAQVPVGNDLRTDCVVLRSDEYTGTPPNITVTTQTVQEVSTRAERKVDLVSIADGRVTWQSRL